MDMKEKVKNAMMAKQAASPAKAPMVAPDKGAMQAIVAKKNETPAEVAAEVDQVAIQIMMIWDALTLMNGKIDGTIGGLNQVIKIIKAASEQGAKQNAPVETPAPEAPVPPVTPEVK